MWTVSTMSKRSDGVSATLGPERREAYRHGNLRAALVAEGLQLAGAGGPNAIVLREVTRRAGVASNAAYRHFADREALVSAVSVEAQRLVADGMSREVESRRAADGDDAASAAAELAAIGRAYVHFAIREPGLLETAFTVHGDLAHALGDAAGPAPVGPYALLSAALDRCVAAGLMDPASRPGAEIAAWSSVHGLAGLLLHGPLRFLEGDAREAAIERVLRMVVAGL
jgi:AcrR family transcriptional regulator